MAGQRRAIGIGVGLVGGMPRLDGARRDAARFCDWAERSGYVVNRFIDADNAPIDSGTLRTSIKKILTPQAEDPPVERLLIYFAGHGTALPTGDIWLLSDFETDGNECINVDLSIRTAKQHPIGQVSIIADACRSSIPAGHQVSPFNLFPSPNAAAVVTRQARIDTFLATRAGTIAQEVPGADPTKSFGVFSKCVLTALDGKAPPSIDTTRTPNEVTSQKLGRWLEDTVPSESGRIPGGVVQFPDVVHGWASPDDWYVQIAGPAAAAAPPPSVQPGRAGQPRFHSASRDRGLGFGFERSGGDSSASPDPPPPHETPPVPPASTLESAAARAKAVVERHFAILNASGRESFETRQGMRVVGAQVVEVMANPPIPSGDIFQENGDWQIRCQDRQHPRSLAIRLDDGRWVGAVALPDFIGTLLVTGREVASLNYKLSRSSPKWDGPGLKYSEAVARWSALTAAGQSVPSDEFIKFARLIRQGKHINPTLGILAAYAYDRGHSSGNPFDAVDSVARYFAKVSHFVPFDVAFLSSTPLPRLGEEATFHAGGLSAKAEVAGGFPLMTQGWGLLENEMVDVDSALLDLRSGLQPGLWTCFDSNTGAKFAELVRKGRI